MKSGPSTRRDVGHPSRRGGDSLWRGVKCGIRLCGRSCNAASNRPVLSRPNDRGTAVPIRNTAEGNRLAENEARRTDWKHWGPYVSERAWGTVREDYSANGDAWSFFPHEHARSRAYRWNEDGLGG